MPVVKDDSLLGGGCAHVAGKALLGARPLEALASGHPDSLLTDPGGNVLKVASGNEVRAYMKLQADPLVDYVAGYRGLVRVQGRDEKFLCLQNLLEGFRGSPHILDCKMGIRTFLESECSSAKQRADLYEKLVRLDPGEPTAEEREAGAITKLRYMTAREQKSSSSSLGFRIDGYASPPPFLMSVLRPAWSRESNFGNLRDPVLIAMHFASYLRRAIRSVRQQVKAAEAVIQRLTDLRDTLLKSDFFSTHEFIGSSLLFAVDSTGTASVWIIDLAKVVPVPEGIAITHRDPWEQGNHEDGYLKGLHEMILLWQTSVEIIHRGEMAEGPPRSAGSACSTTLLVVPVLAAAVLLCVAAGRADAEAGGSTL
eukprot:TRINITY_DN35699_c0_g1_i1.p1 TRINITY_DN35699_c0_g1~~TRINITY_DN35699_c0_g1_i1.p1  ORF type:complete len:368 (+),score=96.14 TRINITY_DN35699_c0_g1_i1:231-1334(+)